MIFRRPLLSILAAGLTAAPVPGADLARHHLRALLPDGRFLHFVCVGEGSPTVLMEGGFGADAGAWSKVQPELARDVRACSYDRAGYGSSDPGPAPRDGAAIARDLDQGLRAARIPGPYVLVGHSAGALYMQVFARRRPHDVVGMVLVDPSVAHQDERFADFGPGAGSVEPLKTRAARCAAFFEGKLALPDGAEQRLCVKRSPHGPGAVAAAAFWRTEVAELDALWTATSDEAATGAGGLGAMPLIVLTAGGRTPAADDPLQTAFEARWRALHREVAARSTVGVERLVPGASHLIMIDRPDVVADAVREVVAQARRKPRRR